MLMINVINVIKCKKNKIFTSYVHYLRIRTKKIKKCEEYRLWLPIMPTFCGQNVCMSCEWIIDYAKRGRERRGQMDR